MQKSSNLTTTSLFTPGSLPASRVEISTSAVLHNLALFKQFVGNGLVAPVIKSNAYGHGMHAIAHICEQTTDADYLCVSNIEHALALRLQGITKPIIVLYLDTLHQDLLYAAIAHSIDLMVYDVQLLGMLSTLAQRANKTANLHLKVETGLGRFGVFPHEVAPFIAALKALPMLFLRGIATHGAGATAEDPTLMLSHLQKFNAVLKELEHLALLPPLRHALSTSGTLRFDHGKQNMFRIGDGTYGIWQSDKERVLSNYPHFQLRPALQWKTIIIAFSTTSTTTHALLPVGFYDGYERRFNGSAFNHVPHVQINNHFAPVVATTMSTTTIDVSAINNLKLGDEVTLLGHHAPTDMYTLAHCLGSGNPTEIITRIAAHVPRIVVP